jgi:hypothetical protein
MMKKRSRGAAHALPASTTTATTEDRIVTTFYGLSYMSPKLIKLIRSIQKGSV